MAGDTPMVLVPRAVLDRALYAMARGYERLHSLPRITDTALADQLEAAKAALRDAALSASPARGGMGALQPQAASVPTEQAGGPVVALFQHCTDDERWMVEAFGLAEFEKLSTDGHAGLADDLLRDAERADQRGEPGTGSRIRAASNFIKAAVSLRRKFPAPSTTSTAEQVGIS